MPTIGAVKAGESLSEIAASVVLLDHGDGVRSKGTVNLSMASFVLSLKFIPSVVDDLPKR